MSIFLNYLPIFMPTQQAISNDRQAYFDNPQRVSGDAIRGFLGVGETFEQQSRMLLWKTTSSICKRKAIPTTRNAFSGTRNVPLKLNEI